MKIESFTNSELLTELADRGVFRVYRIEQYLPDAVARRFQGDAVTRKVMAELLHSLTLHLQTMNTIAYESFPATARNKDAPPLDTIYAAEIIVVDPKVSPTDVGISPPAEGLLQ